MRIDLSAGHLIRCGWKPTRAWTTTCSLTRPRKSFKTTPHRPVPRYRDFNKHILLNEILNELRYPFLEYHIDTLCGVFNVAVLFRGWLRQSWLTFFDQIMDQTEWTVFVGVNSYRGILGIVSLWIHYGKHTALDSKAATVEKSSAAPVLDCTGDRYSHVRCNETRFLDICLKLRSSKSMFRLLGWVVFPSW